jgi:predicted fused transcriptional regulator/phosphomethylpyrimidine kinase
MTARRRWQIVEILPEVSTMVAYNAVWMATAAEIAARNGRFTSSLQ